MRDVYLIIRFTRHWIHYGFLTHVAICSLVAAVEGVMGRYPWLTKLAAVPVVVIPVVAIPTIAALAVLIRTLVYAVENEPVRPLLKRWVVRDLESHGH
jgi:hypothetical protein